jgi:SAM-dependent methyltransferase
VVSCTIKNYQHTYKTYVQPESAIAHRLLDGKCGIEIGAGACNPFGLATVHVGLAEEADPVDFNNHKNGQLHYCGDVAPIDVVGELSAIPILDSVADFVLHSHVWEHSPNPLKALREWVRVVKDNGIIFAIVPHRSALPTDVGRPVTTMQQLEHYLLEDAQPADFPDIEHRGHYIVFSTDLLLNIMFWFNERFFDEGLSLSLLAFLEVDDKAGNGHLVAWRVNKHEMRTADDIAMCGTWNNVCL